MSADIAMFECDTCSAFFASPPAGHCPQCGEFAPDEHECSDCPGILYAVHEDGSRVAVVSVENFQARSSRIGQQYEQDVLDWVKEKGWQITGTKVRHESGIELDVVAIDLAGATVGIECKGGTIPGRRGLERTDNVWKVLGQTLVLHNWNRAHPDKAIRFLCVTSAQPSDDVNMAEPLRVAEANGQLTIVAVPQRKI